MAAARSSRPGHLAEARLVDAFGKLPGVESVDLSGSFEDKSCKIDILVRLKGDYDPLQLQVTGNPRKSGQGLPKDVIFFRFDLGQAFSDEGLEGLAEQAMRRVVNWLKDNEPERLQGLLAYWGI